MVTTWVMGSVLVMGSILGGAELGGPREGKICIVP